MPGRVPSKEELRFIRSAETAYVFPYKSLAPLRPDEKHLRLLGSEARKKLLALLGEQTNWYYGLFTIGEPPDYPSIGVVLRSGRDELDLFFNFTTIHATFHGQQESGMLEDGPKKKFEEWKQRYASHELQAR